MGRKPQSHDWPEAEKLCRLNQKDIAMAKSLGFGPDALVRAMPGARQKWKLPVKYWIHELHFKRFGRVLGEEPVPAPPPTKIEYDEEAARLYGEQVYREEYEERNAGGRAGKPRPGKSAAAPPGSVSVPADES